MASPAEAEHVVKRFGLTEVFAASSDTKVDIVFIHGLHGSPQDTWSGSSKSSSGSWPATLLGPLLREQDVRILLYGYAAEIASFTDGASGDKIHNHAEHLIAELVANRRASKAEHPIIFVAHSLGGLVLKRALIYSSEIRGIKTEHLRSIFVSTYGILFLATPHRGLSVATWRSRLGAICRSSLPIDSVNDNLQSIDALKSNNETLQNIDRQFIHLSRSLRLFFFHEGKPTDLGGGRWEYIVDEESASPTIQDVERAVIQKDHAQISRFEGVNEPSFHIVAEAIQRYASEAPCIIVQRWNSEKSFQLARKKAEANESLQGSKSDSTGACSEQRQSEASFPQVWAGESHDLHSLSLKDKTYQQKSMRLKFSISTVPEIDYFVGRVGDISSMESVLLPYTAAKRKVLVLHGLGGIGKTQLAIEYAKKHQHEYTAVLWLNAKTEDLLRRSFESHISRFDKQSLSDNLTQGTQKERSRVDSVREININKWLDAPGNDRWLLIFDNVDDPKVPDNKSETSYDIESYFPKSYQGSIIITTRWKSLRVGHLQEVRKLSDDEDSISLLERTSGRALRKDHAIQRLIKKLDGLPLALATAGSFLGDTSCSLSDYLHYHETSWRELQQESPRLLSYEDKSIYSTWRISYIHIRREDRAAAKFLELWGYLDNQKLWYELIQSGIDEYAPAWFQKVAKTKLSFQATCGRLQKHALIEGLIGSDGYSKHHCVHRWVKTVLAPNIDGDMLALALTCVAGAVHPQITVVDTSNISALMAHSEMCNKGLESYSVQNIPASVSLEHSIPYFYANVGQLYLDRFNYTTAENMLLRASKAYEDLKGATDRETLKVLDHLAFVYSEQHRFNEAEAIFERVLAQEKEVLGPADFSLVTTMNNMSCMYHRQNRLSEAETLCRQALDLKETTLGRSDASTLNTAHNLGIIYWHQGKITDAEAMFQQVATGLQLSLGENHPSRIRVLGNLADMYLDQRLQEKSEPIIQDILASEEERPGPVIRDVLAIEEGEESEVENNIPYSFHLARQLAKVYYAQGKLDLAESMLRRIVSIRERKGGGMWTRYMS